MNASTTQRPGLRWAPSYEQEAQAAAAGVGRGRLPGPGHAGRRSHAGGGQAHRRPA